MLEIMSTQKVGQLPYPILHMSNDYCKMTEGNFMTVDSARILVLARLFFIVSLTRQIEIAVGLPRQDAFRRVICDPLRNNILLGVKL